MRAAMDFDIAVLVALRNDHYRVEAGLIGSGLEGHILAQSQRMPLDEVKVWARMAFTLAAKALPEVPPCG